MNVKVQKKKKKLNFVGNSDDFDFSKQRRSSWKSEDEFIH